MLIKHAITSLAITATLAICLTLPPNSQAASPCYYGSLIYTAANDGTGAYSTYSPEIINGIRQSGYAAMDDMRTQYKDTIKTLDKIAAQTKGAKLTPENKRQIAELTKYRNNLETLIEQVAQQRGATESGLLWHTDLDEAIKEANKTDKPILSLRMLGNLTDEFSCANSRFFRTTLYSNQEISKLLRKDFVLHWKSVRPVPKITVDFGDGRTLERTITGNSAHYMLDKSGRPLDCLPGLYGPGEFTNWLGKMAQLNTETKHLKSAAKDQRLKQYHKFQNMLAGMTLETAMAKVAPELNANISKDNKLKKFNTANNPTPRTATRIAARTAAPIALSKSLGEVPILDLAFSNITPEAIDEFEKEMNDAKWEKLAELHAGTEKLDASSIEVIKRENPTATQASDNTRAKRRTEDKLTRLVESFQRSILIDTVRNEYLLHRKVHSWFSQELPTNVEVLNKRVYAELFLTPDTDPWLGLKPDDVYSALQNDGVKVAAKK